MLKSARITVLHKFQIFDSLVLHQFQVKIHKQHEEDIM